MDLYCVYLILDNIRCVLTIDSLIVAPNYRLMIKCLFIYYKIYLCFKTQPQIETSPENK